MVQNQINLTLILCKKQMGVPATKASLHGVSHQAPQTGEGECLKPFITFMRTVLWDQQ